MKKRMYSAASAAFLCFVTSSSQASDHCCGHVEQWNPFAQSGDYRTPPHIRHRQHHVRPYHHDYGVDPYRRFHHRHHVVHRYPRPSVKPDHHHGRCGPEVSAVGTEHYAEDEAKKAAIKSWMAEVRHRFGTEMMDINNAREPTFRCVISTPGDRVSDKIAQWTRGDLLKECRIVAHPCKPDIDHALPRDVRR